MTALQIINNGLELNENSSMLELTKSHQDLVRITDFLSSDLAIRGHNAALANLCKLMELQNDKILSGMRVKLV